MIEIYQMPFISTAHLPSKDAIEKLGVLNAPYAYGWFVFMDDSIDAPWFEAIREWAVGEVGEDCWVRFDAAADEVPTLDTYDW